MMDASIAEVMVGAASNSVDLWLEVRWGLPVSGGALLGVVSALATIETSVVAAAVLQHGLFAKGLVLADCLIVVVAIVPRRLVFRGGRFPNVWLLHKLLPVVLLGFKLPLAIIIPGLVFTLCYESLVHQSQEVRKVQHTELTTEGMVQSS
jgi:hypothetical protein